MRTAIILYSLSGNTRLVAEAVARHLATDISVIEAPQVRPAGFAVFRLGMAAWFGWTTPVSLTGAGFSGCDAVILASPVWAGRVSVPMRSWLAQAPALPARLGLILTGGAPVQSEKPFAEFARLANAQPRAQLYIGEQALKSGNLDTRVAGFCTTFTT